MRSLQQIIEKVGNLHSVNYKAIILESVETDGADNESPSSSLQTNANMKQNQSGGDSGNIPVTSKDSGDGSMAMEIDELNEDANEVQPKISVKQVETTKSYSENISVSIIHDGLTIYAIGKLQNKVCTPHAQMKLTLKYGILLLF